MMLAFDKKLERAAAVKVWGDRLTCAVILKIKDAMYHITSSN